MFDALSGIACFVTATVSFLYGTRVAWLCGKKCNFTEDCEYKKQTLRGCLPAAIGIYFFGFLIVFSLLTNGLITVLISALTSAILLANFVVSMAMPVLKRKPSIK